LKVANTCFTYGPFHSLVKVQSFSYFNCTVVLFGFLSVFITSIMSSCVAIMTQLCHLVSQLVDTFYVCKINIQELNRFTSKY